MPKLLRLPVPSVYRATTMVSPSRILVFSYCLPGAAGSGHSCVLVDEIIPDAVVCQDVELGLHVLVVAACLAHPCVDVGYGDQRLIFAQGPLCFT